MALFEVTAYDKKIYEEELKDFLPDKIFDVHCHIALQEHKKPAPKKQEAPAVTYSTGDTVVHKVFGQGVILSSKPMGNDSMLEIAFEKVGTKKLMVNFAKLKKE